MVKFIFVRHGLSTTNNTGRFTGHLDAPLHERGLKQAEQVASYVAANFAVDTIYSSTSSRAYHTALPTAKALGLPIIKSERLCEVSVGCWGGRTFEEIKREYPTQYALWKENIGLARYGDGETTAEAQARMISEVNRIAAENDNKTVFIATHGAVLRALYCSWHGIPLEQLKDVPIVSNASISIATYEKGKGTFSLVGYDEHLLDKTPHIPHLV